MFNSQLFFLKIHFTHMLITLALGKHLGHAGSECLLGSAAFLLQLLNSLFEMFAFCRLLL